LSPVGSWYGYHPAHSAFVRWIFVLLREGGLVGKYDIRAAEPNDLLSVARLIERRPELSTCDLTEAQREAWSRMMGREGLTVYVAWSADDAIGTTALLVMPHITYSCRPTAFLESMYVREEHRRQGVARMMVERVLEDAREAGCYKVQLLTHKRHADDGAHAFYRSMGFDAEAEGFRRYLS
jgi:GNAT superfamily N-acetyltransferase